MRVYYCDQHHFPLPPGHKFPLRKYGLIREALNGDGAFDLQPAPLATREDLVRVHDSRYVDGFLEGTLERDLLRRIGFPWSPELVRRTLASAGGTLSAARHALHHGLAGTLAGGTHHAARGEGSGFCVFNDLAISIEGLRAQTALRRFAVVDLDVHQGDGTAAIFSNDPNVFTLSLHGASNFPFRKQQSSLDVALPDRITDGPYLDALCDVLEHVWEFGPQAVFFQSGVDGLATDRLGRLALSLDGLRQRDELVIGETLRRNLPLVITLGGGYSEPIEHTVAAHVQTFRIAAEHYRMASISSTSAIERPL